MFVVFHIYIHLFYCACCVIVNEVVVSLTRIHFTLFFCYCICIYVWYEIAIVVLFHCHSHVVVSNK